MPYLSDAEQEIIKDHIYDLAVGIKPNDAAVTQNATATDTQVAKPNSSSGLGSLLGKMYQSATPLVENQHRDAVGLELKGYMAQPAFDLEKNPLDW